MSDSKYVKETLTMPSEMPFFNYNINFDGLRRIIEEVGLQTNQNKDAIIKIKQQLPTKLPTQQFLKLHKTLDQNLNLGLNIEKHIEATESMAVKVSGKDPKEMDNIERYSRKVQKLADIVEILFIKSNEHEEKLQNDDRKNETRISESTRRIEDKIDASLGSFEKTLNTFFGQASKNTTQLQSSMNTFKLNQQFKLAEITSELNNKVSQFGMKNTLEANQIRFKKQLANMLENDHMRRMAALNEYSSKLKQTEKDVELQQKYTKQKLQQIGHKLNKVLTIANFEAEKHKIYDKLAEFRGKIDEVNHKNSEFVEFRKDTMSNNQKLRQSISGLDEQIQKLNKKESSFKKMENVSEVLSALDPHLICQLGNEVKLHEKEIGKLQKQLMSQQYELSSLRNSSKPAPEVNHGQNADFMTKMIKQYMSNMDFEGRVKKMERDVHQLNKKNDIVHDVEKKIYLLTKEMDMGLIMKEIKKKSDQENTNRDIRVIDGKVEKLFDFYKTLRKQIQDSNRRASKNVKDVFDNASMTTKKLYSPNCISCTPQSASRQRRHYSRPKIQMSYDQTVEPLKSSSYLLPRGKN